MDKQRGKEVQTKEDRHKAEPGHANIKRGRRGRASKGDWKAVTRGREKARGNQEKLWSHKPKQGSTSKVRSGHLCPVPHRLGQMRTENPATRW